MSKLFTRLCNQNLYHWCTTFSMAGQNTPNRRGPRAIPAFLTNCFMKTNSFYCRLISSRNSFKSSFHFRFETGWRPHCCRQRGVINWASDLLSKDCRLSAHSVTFHAASTVRDRHLQKSSRLWFNLRRASTAKTCTSSCWFEERKVISHSLKLFVHLVVNELNHVFFNYYSTHPTRDTMFKRHSIPQIARCLPMIDTFEFMMIVWLFKKEANGILPTTLFIRFRTIAGTGRPTYQILLII